MLFVFHSLAKLRECTINVGEGGTAEDATEMSASARSVISAIPSDKINSMIQEVKSLSVEMLKVQLSNYQHFPFTIFVNITCLEMTTTLFTSCICPI